MTDPFRLRTFDCRLHNRVVHLLQTAFQQSGHVDAAQPLPPLSNMTLVEGLNLVIDSSIRVDLLILHLGRTTELKDSDLVMTRSDGTVIRSRHGRTRWTVIEKDRSHPLRIKYLSDLRWPRHLLDQDGLGDPMYPEVLALTHCHLVRAAVGRKV